MSKERHATSMSSEERYKARCQMVLDAHQRYIDWWLPIDVAGGSFMAPMGLMWFCQYLLTFPDEEWFDRWLNKDEFIIPKDGDEKVTRIYMKKFILELLHKHYVKWIDLHNDANPFKELEKKQR